jgi:tRNA nucleotidyltransferase (CCA-adding enzyme)
MQVYLVGGAVRDALLGLPVKDRDWVVVGATPEQMTELGFTPVGKDFPVFLHPHTHEEFALARTERKSAQGYRGFVVHAAPDVTLEQDLSRRDLTINAMAVQAHYRIANGRLETELQTDPSQWQSQGLLHDPYGGLMDLANKKLRHIGPAFTEDPVRILRLARLAARFEQFSPAAQTLGLMQTMVQHGEVHHLVAERVWQELAKGLMSAKPSRMLDILHDCGALAVLLPELDRLHGVAQTAQHHPEVDTWVHTMLVMDMAARLQTPLPVRLACLLHDLGKGTTPASELPRHRGHEERSVSLLKPICERLRIPNECTELALVMAREHGHIHRSASLGAAAVLRLMERCDALRKPQRFAHLLQACACDARGRLGFAENAYLQANRLLALLTVVQAVDTQGISAQALAAGIEGQALGELIRQARLAALQQQLGPNTTPA